MIPQLKILNQQEQEFLIKAPVLLSVLASCSEHTINKAQKSDAIKLAHIRTFTAIPELQPYYKAAENNFKENFEQVAHQYKPYDEAHRQLLKQEIRNIHKIIAKLEPSYGAVLTKSLERYTIHVKRATYSIFQDFIFPLAMLELRDSQSATL